MKTDLLSTTAGQNIQTDASNFIVCLFWYNFIEMTYNEIGSIFTYSLSSSVLILYIYVFYPTHTLPLILEWMIGCPLKYTNSALIMVRIAKNISENDMRVINCVVLKRDNGSNPSKHTPRACKGKCRNVLHMKRINLLSLIDESRDKNKYISTCTHLASYTTSVYIGCSTTTCVHRDLCQKIKIKCQVSMSW